MRSHNLSAVVIAAMTFCVPISAYCAEWFESEGTSCSGAQTIEAGVSATIGGGVHVEAGAGPGNYFVPISALDLSDLASADGIKNRHTVNASEAKSLRHVFLSVNKFEKTPAFVTHLSSLITGLAMPAKIGTATGLLYTYLFSVADASAEETRDVGLFVATGGEFYRKLATINRKSDQNPFASNTIEYKVSLGSESRQFVVFGCLYPLRVDVTKFVSTGPANNMILQKNASGQWQRWSVDDNKFEGDLYKYLYQSGGYYYFGLDAIENNQIVGQDIQRVSFAGGPWQLHRHDDSPNQFFTLYAKVAAK